MIEEIMRHHADAAWYEPGYLVNSLAGEDVLAEIERRRLHRWPVRGESLGMLRNVECRNRGQSKYIINSVRAYEFVGAKVAHLMGLRVHGLFSSCARTCFDTEKDCISIACVNTFSSANWPRWPKFQFPSMARWKSLECLRGPVKTSSAFSRYRKATKRQVRWQLLKAGLHQPACRQEDPLIRTIIRLAGLETADRFRLFW